MVVSIGFKKQPPFFILHEPATSTVAGSTYWS